MSGGGYFGNKYYPDGYFPEAYFGTQGAADPNAMQGSAAGFAVVSGALVQPPQSGGVVFDQTVLAYAIARKRRAEEEEKKREEEEALQRALEAAAKLTAEQPRVEVVTAETVPDEGSAPVAPVVFKIVQAPPPDARFDPVRLRQIIDAALEQARAEELRRQQAEAEAAALRESLLRQQQDDELAVILLLAA